MNDDNEPRWAAIQDIGNEADNADDIPPFVLAKLIEFGLVQVVNDRLALTDDGWKAYKVMESGDGEIPELT